MRALTFYGLVDDSLSHAKPEAPMIGRAHSQFFFHEFSCFSRETQPAPIDLCFPPTVPVTKITVPCCLICCHTHFQSTQLLLLPLRVPELLLSPDTHQIRSEFIIPFNPPFLSTALPFLRLHFLPSPKKDRIFGVSPSVLRLFFVSKVGYSPCLFHRLIAWPDGSWCRLSPQLAR
jgi:hypothetical protein